MAVLINSLNEDVRSTISSNRAQFNPDFDEVLNKEEEEFLLQYFNKKSINELLEKPSFMQKYIENSPVSVKTDDKNNYVVTFQDGSTKTMTREELIDKEPVGTAAKIAVSIIGGMLTLCGKGGTRLLGLAAGLWGAKAAISDMNRVAYPLLLKEADKEVG